MQIGTIRRIEQDGQSWYRAQDVTRFYKRPKVSDITKLVDAGEKIKYTTRPTDWKFRQSDVYISEAALLVAARHYSMVPLAEVRSRLEEL